MPGTNKTEADVDIEDIKPTELEERRQQMTEVQDDG